MLRNRESLFLTKVQRPKGAGRFVPSGSSLWLAALPHCVFRCTHPQMDFTIFRAPMAVAPPPSPEKVTGKLPPPSQADSSRWQRYISVLQSAQRTTTLSIGQRVGACKSCQSASFVARHLWHVICSTCARCIQWPIESQSVTGMQVLGQFIGFSRMMGMECYDSGGRVSASGREK